VAHRRDTRPSQDDRIAPGRLRPQCEMSPMGPMQPRLKPGGTVPRFRLASRNRR
jgi:hypothetical protein